MEIHLGGNDKTNVNNCMQHSYKGYLSESYLRLKSKVIIVFQLPLLYTFLCILVMPEMSTIISSTV